LFAGIKKDRFFFLNRQGVPAPSEKVAGYGLPDQKEKD